MKEILIIIALTTVLVTVSVLMLNNPRKSNSSGGDELKTVNKNLRDTNSYIDPAEFKVGLIRPGEYKSMNDCNHNVLYPINGLGPDYGWKMPKDCKCTQFLQAP